uniref:BZIP domain-containing protein n=1 Tax=Strigamia maritima TaxID=126957 RepID=T1JG20_STRMM
MLSFKKFHNDDLLQLALLLSLLRVDVDLYLNINNNNFGLEYQEIGLGTSSAYIQSYIHNLHNRTSGYHVHPKNVESIFLNQQSLFYELNLLGRYQNYYQINRPNEITTYLLSEEQESHENASEDNTSVPQISDGNHRNSTEVTVTTRTLSAQQDSNPSDISTATSPETSSGPPLGANLTKEDMDLIDVLLRQDIDLGVTRELFDAQLRKEVDKYEQKEEVQSDALSNTEDLTANNPWAGLNYTIDSETGEHEIQDENQTETGQTNAALTEDVLLSLTADFENIPLNEANQLSQEDFKDKSSDSGFIVDSEDLFSSAVTPGFTDSEENLAEQLEQLEDMIQATSQLQVHPNNQPQGTQYLRTNSLEQRWQDLANILSLPLTSESENQTSVPMISPSDQQIYIPGNNNSFGGILLHNASLASPLVDINSNISTYPSEMAAVASSLTAITNGSEPMGDAHSASYLGDEGSLIYPRNHSEINQTTDGFLSSLLNDDDMHLMNLTMTDASFNGTDRFMQQNDTMNAIFPINLDHDDDMDSSSDSAVSSMGSTERMGSLSDGVNSHCRNSVEWMETCSNSSNNNEDKKHYFNAMNCSYGLNKQGAYDSNYSSEHHVTSPLSPPVAQKKIHLYGKRLSTENDFIRPNRNSNGEWEPKYSDCLYNGHDYNAERSFEMVEGATAIEQPEPKFSCSVEFAQQQASKRGQLGQVQHNHTYQLPSESQNAPHSRPFLRDKYKKREEDHLSRDEKRARALKVPMTSNEIISLPMDEFNEKLSKFDLTEPQLALIRDIRRRGKNKVAAQNCRKRKLDQILTLAEVVQELQQNKDNVLYNHEQLLARRQRLQEKYNQLYMHVFQSMRDSHGNPLPSEQYSLQQAANGSMILVPRSNRYRNNLDLDPTSGARAKKKDSKK